MLSLVDVLLILQKANSKAPPQDQVKDTDSKIHVSFEQSSTPTPGAKYKRGFSFHSSEDDGKLDDQENIEKKKERAKTALVVHPLSSFEGSFDRYFSITSSGKLGFLIFIDFNFLFFEFSSMTLILFPNFPS
jgi:hypothetical protein